MSTILHSPTLPLLDYTVSLFPKVSFKDTLIIGVQHLLPTTHSLFHALFQMGLPISNLRILGKCYSTNPSTFNQMKAEGIFVSPLSTYFDSHVAYDDLFQEILEKFLLQILREQDLSQYEKVIFLDDGGHLLQAVHSLQIKLPNIFGVEQTSAGYNNTKFIKFTFPIINLARSWLKLIYETPLILQSSLLALNSYLERLEAENNAILILGNGVLGSSVYQSLKPKFNVSIYDKDPSLSLIPHSVLPSTIENFSIIIGCTGAISIPQALHKYLDSSVLLASMSSSDREFDAVHLRKKIPVENDCHRHLTINNIKLLNCGFPINFDDKYTSVDSDSFQITRSIILASLVQIQSGNGLLPGFLDLDDQVQKAILQELLILREIT